MRSRTGEGKTMGLHVAETTLHVHNPQPKGSQSHRDHSRDDDSNYQPQSIMDPVYTQW